MFIEINDLFKWRYKEDSKVVFWVVNFHTMVTQDDLFVPLQDTTLRYPPAVKVPASLCISGGS
jgi:hypothetical protein